MHVKHLQTHDTMLLLNGSRWLEETSRTSSRNEVQDYIGRPEIKEPLPLIWLRNYQSGDRCLYLALCTLMVHAMKKNSHWHRPSLSFLKNAIQYSSAQIRKVVTSGVLAKASWGQLCMLQSNAKQTKWVFDRDLNNMVSKLMHTDLGEGRGKFQTFIYWRKIHCFKKQWKYHDFITLTH